MDAGLKTGGLTAEAARRIDKLIHERVMGFKRFEPQLNAMEMQPLTIATPSYSEEIGAAWKIVEHFKAKGYAFNIEVWDSGTKFRAFIGGHEASASTAPLAISLAALITLGGKVNVGDMSVYQTGIGVRIALTEKTFLWLPS